MADAIRRDRISVLWGRWVFVASALLCGCSTTDAPHREKPAPEKPAAEKPAPRVAASTEPVRSRAFVGPLPRVENPVRAVPRPAVAASDSSLLPAAPGVPPDYLRLLMIQEAQRIKEAAK